MKKLKYVCFNVFLSQYITFSLTLKGCDISDLNDMAIQKKQRVKRSDVPRYCKGIRPSKYEISLTGLNNN